MNKLEEDNSLLTLQYPFFNKYTDKLNRTIKPMKMFINFSPEYNMVLSLL